MDDLTGVGAVLVGLAAVIGSVASFYMSIKNTKKITDIDKKTADIDHAVNGRPPGAVPMQKQVADLHSDRPAPVPYPVELENAAIRDMLKDLVADMHDRRDKRERRDKS